MSSFRRARAVLTSTLLAGVCLAASAQQDAQPQDVKPPAQEAKPAAQEAKPAAQDPKPPAADSKQPQTRLRSGVDLVSLSVTVMDGTRYVADLDEEAFEVYEDGARQAITFFSRVQQPIALAILLDTSASMNERLGTAQEAAIGFAKRMRREDVMEVIDFDSQARILQTFTNDVAALEKAIRSTDVNGSTSLYNAIYISLKELKRATANSPRRSAGRRLSSCPTATTRRAWCRTKRCSTSPSGRRPRSTPSACGPAAAIAPSSRKQSSS